MRTGNGGRTWVDISPANDYRVCSIHDVFFTNSLNGWIAGEAQSYSDSQPFGFTMHTMDGGKTWSTAKLPKNSNTFLSSVKFDDNGNGWLIGDGEILSSADGGNSWKISYKNRVNSYFHIEINENRIWIVGSNGSILSSNINEGNWNKIKLQKNVEKFWFSDIKFINNRKGWIVGGFSDIPVILSTEDGGASWTSEKIADADGYLKSIDVSGTKLIAVGEENIILTAVRDKN